jgi:DNA repair ATPase RecN
MHWIEQLRAFFRGGEKVADSTKEIDIMSPANENDVRLADFLKMLANTREDEISCDDVHHLLDQYAEVLTKSEDAARIMPMVRQHLEICHECDEELQAVLDILRSLPST